METTSKDHVKKRLHKARRTLELARLNGEPYPELRRLQRLGREAYSDWLDWLNANTVFHECDDEFMFWTDAAAS